jgi:DNA invertase Pin-like site-specific DNA recombinase
VLPRKIGYARVSTDDQDTALQRAALLGAGCELVFDEKVSGASEKRPGLEGLLRELKEGDTLVVWKLDRLGRRTLPLLKLVEELVKRGVHFNCITQGLDTSTPMGRMTLTIFAGFAEFELEMIVERTRAGLKAAHAKGHYGQRPRKLTGKKLQLAKQLYVDRPISPKTGKSMNVDELAAHIGVAKTTLYRYVMHGGVPRWSKIRDPFLERNPDVALWLEKTDDPMYGRNPDKVKRAS